MSLGVLGVLARAGASCGHRSFLSCSCGSSLARPLAEGTGFVGQPGLGVGKAATELAAHPRVLFAAGARAEALLLGLGRNRFAARADVPGRRKLLQTKRLPGRRKLLQTKRLREI